MTESEKKEKLQKALASAGLGSRRACEQWILEGRLKINDRVAQLGDRVSLHDKIYLDDHLIKKNRALLQKTEVLLYHKPAGQICTRHDPQGRPTSFDALPALTEGRWIAIGRLDMMTSGLLLFTNDGELAHRCMHPSYQIEREYAVRVYGHVSPDTLRVLQAGVELKEGKAHFETIVYKGGEGRNQWYHVTLRTGKYHEVRNLWESQGVRVSRLIRVRFGPVGLPPLLKPRCFRYLDAKDIQGLRALCAL